MYINIKCTGLVPAEAIRGSHESLGTEAIGGCEVQNLVTEPGSSARAKALSH